MIHMSPAEHAELPVLKGRQFDCMQLVKEGLSSKQIARKLGISPRTVDQHIAAAVETLGVSSRLAAVARLNELDQEKAELRSDASFMLNNGAAANERYAFGSNIWTENLPALPPPGGCKNTASRNERLVWLTRIAILSIMTTCAFLLFILAVSGMVEGFDQ